MLNQSNGISLPEINSKSDFRDLRAGHLAIKTSDYLAMIKWYIEKLDFRIVYEWIVGDLQLALIAPATDNNFMIEILGFKDDERLDNSAKASGYDHICFNVDNLDKTIEDLKVRNIEITRCFSVPQINKRVAFIMDPFGNTIEFCEDLK
jgi:catechol 2,3-dioxygenase-like lactoylglutathione lyase family enzyme